MVSLSIGIGASRLYSRTQSDHFVMYDCRDSLRVSGMTDAVMPLNDSLDLDVAAMDLV